MRVIGPPRNNASSSRSLSMPLVLLEFAVPIAEDVEVAIALDMQDALSTEDPITPFSPLPITPLVVAPLTPPALILALWDV